MAHRHSPLIVIYFVIVCSCSATDDNPRRISSGQGGQAGAPASAGNAGKSASGGSSGGSTNQSGGSSNTGGSSTSSGGSGASGGAGGSTANTGGTGGSGAPACVPGSGTEDVGSASLLDKKTCLVWQNAKSSKTMNNREAAKYCSDLVQDGLDDWRTPLPEELVAWPKLAEDSTAFITGPTYIPTSAPSDEEGCTGNAHSCNITKYNSGAPSCAWQGVGFTGWVVCVSGTAQPGSLDTSYEAASCAQCSSHVGAEFKTADCIPYVK